MKAKEGLKDSFLWNHRKDILLYMFILIAVLGTVKAVSVLTRGDSSDTVQAAWTSNCYRLYINGIDMGLVETREIGETAIKKAIKNLTLELGYDPEVKPEIRYYEEYSEDLIFVPGDLLVPQLQKVIKDGIDVIKVKAYAMKIGDDFVATLQTEDDVKAVLNNAKNRFISDGGQFGVILERNENNSLIETPKIVLTKEILTNDRIFATTAQSNVDQVGNENMVHDMELSDDPNNGVTVGVNFTEEIMVVETFVNRDQILSVQEATEMITKENEKPKTYIVKEGDCPSTIAADNNMDLETLYHLNPSMGNGAYVQIGDELTVLVPEPELSVTTVEQVCYKEYIERGTTYVDNPNAYVGSDAIIDAGYDGERKVVALITKDNGVEISRVITEQEIIKEPKDKVVSRGTKPLPPKGATGQFIVPVSKYTFTSGFGPRWGTFHAGIDLAAPIGTTIMAADGGTVVYAGWYSGYGYYVKIDHGDGITTCYGHCSSISVSVGQVVSQYEEIAKVGSTGNSTGPHLHFEIRLDGNAVNPVEYLFD